MCSVRWNMEHWLIPTLIGITVSTILSASAAVSFSENFAGGTLNSALQAPSPNYYSFNGPATIAEASDRSYIATTATDFLAADFTATLTYTIASGNDSMFVGIGNGTPAGGFYGEPDKAIYLRACPPNFGSGQVHVTINNGAGSVNEGATLVNLLSGATSRVQITKTGDSLTFALDYNSSSGTFVADYSQTFSLASSVGFLDNSDSRFFFGTQAGVTFNALDVNITPVPEINPLVPASLMLVGAVTWQRRRTGRLNTDAAEPK